MALDEFRKFSPNGARALIDERDAYLAHQLIGLSHALERVLAVVGAGHVAGIRRYLADPRPPSHRSLSDADGQAVPLGSADLRSCRVRLRRHARS